MYCRAQLGSLYNLMQMVSCKRIWLNLNKVAQIAEGDYLQWSLCTVEFLICSSLLFLSNHSYSQLTNPWSPQEKTFICLCMAMGVLQLPARHDYRSQCKSLSNTSTNYVSRDHFYNVWRYLHLHDSTSPPPPKPDRLIKIRWFLEHLNQTFMEQYTPHEWVTVD